MKRIVTLLLAGFLGCMPASSQEKPSEEMTQGKVLVVYFSATGTTRRVAEQLASITEADLCEIVPKRRYTPADLDWHNKQSRSSVEMNNPQARPAIKPVKTDISQYSRIFLGYPIWWNQAPRVVNSFIESCDLTGKVLIPFATSGSSAIGNSVDRLKEYYPQLQWQTGKLLNQASENILKEWIDTL